MTDAQYRAARKSASDFTRRQKQRQRARNKKGPSKIYIDPVTGVRSTHPFLKKLTPPLKGPVQRMPQRPSTLGKLFKGASTKPKGGFLKALGASPLTKKPPPNQFKKFTPKMLVPKPGDPSKIPFGPTGKPLKKAKSPRQLERERIQKERYKILKARGPVKPTKQPSVTSRYRGGSGKKKYNQAAYFAGLGVNPNTKQNQGIYKPYANGGGVRKPKYKE